MFWLPFLIFFLAKLPINTEAASGVIELGNGSLIIVPEDDILSINLCAIFIQGAKIPPTSYIPLLRQVQTISSNFKLWVGIPRFPGDMVQNRHLSHGIDDMKIKLNCLTTCEKYIMIGHSLGGAILQTYVDKHRDEVLVQILLGSFLTRNWKENYVFKYFIPTITIGGELDGLTRITRIAEAFAVQLLKNSTEVSLSMDFSHDSYRNFPVTTIKGVSHAGFASGKPPPFVHSRDLRPEVSEEVAHKYIALDIIAFLDAHIIQDPKSLYVRIAESFELLGPIIESQVFEGYHNFLPPCYYRNKALNANQPTCLSSCPLASKAQSLVFEEILDINVFNNQDLLQNMWNSKVRPKMYTSWNSSTSTKHIRTETVSQIIYRSGQTVDFWKLHIDDAKIDASFFPLSADEIRIKMNSVGSLGTLLGINGSVDTWSDMCRKINSWTLSWATNKLPNSTRNRFINFGQKIQLGSDIKIPQIGPVWLLSKLTTRESKDRHKIIVTSPALWTSMRFPIKSLRGLQYCKLLSPARTIEWMYIDGLRTFYSIKDAY